MPNWSASHARQGVRFTRSNGTPSVRRAEVQRRTGALAVKAGMFASWDEHGRRHALTVLHLDGCRVVQVKEKEKHGYTALQLGVCPAKFKHVNKPLLGHFAKWAPPEKPLNHAVASNSDTDARDDDDDDDDDESASSSSDRRNADDASSSDDPTSESDEYPYRLLKRLEEFRVSPDAVLEVGTPITAAHFFPGQFVDIQGTTKGKGFQGAMKKWGFAGQGASHGNSKAHRALGSVGQCADPGKIWKGKKMAGKMGNKRRTVQNLVVHRVDVRRNLVVVRGAVPGNKGGICRITDSIKRRHHPTMKLVDEGGKLHFPTIPKNILDDLPPVWEWQDEPEPKYYPPHYAH